MVHSSITTPRREAAGYGTGTCQDSQDSTLGLIYPRFFKFGQPGGTDNYATPAFARADDTRYDVHAHWTDDNGPRKAYARSTARRRMCRK